MKYLILSLLIIGIFSNVCIATLNPILFVPGGLRNFLNVKVSTPHPIIDSCPLEASFSLTGGLCPPNISSQCVRAWLRLNYNENINSFSSPEGIDVTLPSAYGSMNDIAPSFILSDLPLIANLTHLGYQYAENFIVIPYDWRIHPTFTDFTQRFKVAVEFLYNNNNQQKVVVLGCSEGTSHANYALINLSQEWKDNYIHSLVLTSITAPAGFAAVYPYLIGSLDVCTFTLLNRSSDYSNWTLILLDIANPLVYNNQILLQTPSFQFTASDINKVLSIAGLHFYETILPSLWNDSIYLNGPNVDVYCLIGIENETVVGAIYSDDELNSIPSMIIGDGDGDVDTIGATACKYWKTNTNNVFIKEYEYYDFLSWFGLSYSSDLAMPLYIKIIQS